MVIHNNPSIVQRAQQKLNTKMGMSLPDEISGPVATIEIAPIVNIVRVGASSVSGTITIFTTPTDKDFYLTSAMLSMIKDAANDATGGINLNVVIDGVTREVIVFAILASTAQTNTIVCQCSPPIKLDRGSTVTISGTYTAGLMRRTGSIQGYFEEVTK